jgi:predicted Zn finger-like uncharacterized protein
MLIVCKTCASSYHIPREILGENGCRLRCVGCGEAWTVTPRAAAADGAPIVEGQRMATLSVQAPWNGAERRPGPFSGEANGVWPEEEEPKPAPGGPFGFRGNKSGGGAAIAAILIVAGAMAVAGERAAIVRLVPNTARLFAAVGLPVNLRGLALDNVRTNIFDLGDRRVLVIEGAIVNLRDSATEAPNIRIALRGADKRELYAWTAPAPKSRLEPDEQVAFRTRLAAPPDGVSDVLVKFASVGDRLSPMKDGL